MEFEFGKYEHGEISHILEIDLDYCHWVVDSPEIENYPENKKVLQWFLEYYPKPRRDSIFMPFGKYKGQYIDNIVTDISHSKWLLKKEWFKNDYPKEYDYFKSLFDIIMQQAEKTMYFYCLVLSGGNGIKVGKTIQYVPKRLYNYVCATNNYTLQIKENPIDIKKSFVFKTNDFGIEKHIKNIFKDSRIHGFELLNIDIESIENELLSQSKKNSSLFYYKKSLSDFIPYDTLADLRKVFVIYMDKHVCFKKEYENHLQSKGLITKYDPDFVGGNLS